MEQEVYDRLMKEHGAVQMIRPYEIDSEYHRKFWKAQDITVLICQKKTKDLTQLCLESLLRFYPDIKILVVDGNSEDDSTLYLRYMAKKFPNIELWERVGRDSHGDTMNEAIRDHIKTKYVILMDSDVITERGGWIELMLKQFEEDKKLYATGTLMIVTRRNFAVGAPDDEKDILRYAHPSLAVYHRETYLGLARAHDHGSPLVYNMLDAEKKGLRIGDFPIDRYVSHLSGGSWTHPHRTIWNNDHDVFIRPFITFITTLPEQFELLKNQTDHDFDIVTRGNLCFKQVIFHDDSKPLDVHNLHYEIRFHVTGEYICLLHESLTELETEFVTHFKQSAIELFEQDEITIGTLTIVKRKVWQRKYSVG